MADENKIYAEDEPIEVVAEIIDDDEYDDFDDDEAFEDDDDFEDDDIELYDDDDDIEEADEEAGEIGVLVGDDGAPLLMALRYGNEVNIDKDVDLFQDFYVRRYGRAAAERIHARDVRNQRFIAYGCLAVGIVATFPKLVLQIPSPFAITLLITAIMLIIGGLYMLKKASKKYDPSDEGVAELLYEEFTTARSKRNRIFRLHVSEKGVQTLHGIKTGVKQKHYKTYEEMTCVDITDDLIFIKGITWFCQFQLGEERYERLCSILKEKCGSVVNDERTGEASPEPAAALPLAQ